MISRKFFAIAASTGLLALGVTACGDSTSGGGTSGSGGGGSLSGKTAGVGSSAQEAAQAAWIAGVQEENTGVTISYDPAGSGAGREQFIAGGATAYAGSDAPLDPKTELADAKKRCAPGELIQIPVYISPIAMVYNLPGVEGLQLSPETLAKIFNQEITTWNDQAIAADNPDANLPDTRITPVNRSDESGTTENFTDYLSKAAPDVWTYEVSGDWPVKGGESASGTSGVIDAVKNGDGTIGYADASQAGDLGVATVKVGEEFVGPTPEAAAAIVDESPEDTSGGQYVFSYDLDRTTTAQNTYPIILASYELACTQYPDVSEAAIVKALLSYEVSPEGQDAAASNAGSAPISDQIREQIMPAVEAIGSKG